MLTNHPFLSGRPGRAAVLERLIADAVADPRVWVCAMDEHGRPTSALSGWRPRAVTRPAPPD